MPRLVFTDRSGQSRSFALKKKIVSIGRARDNDLVLDDPAIALSHAHVLCDANGFVISGMDPKHPLMVNGRSRRSQSLKPDDQISLGATILTFLMDDAPPPPLAPLTSRREGSSTQLGSRLLQFSDALMRDLSNQELFRTLLDQLIQITGADKGFLIRVQGGKLESPVARNLDQSDLERSLEHISDSIIHKVIDSGEALIISDALHDARFGQAKSVVDLKLSSIMCVPLKFRNELLGVLYLGNDRIANLFQPDDLEMLKIYAGQASLILYNAQLVNDLIVSNRELKDELKSASLGRIIGQSDPMRAISRTIDKVANTDISVMIRGETGTGKELIARELHARSTRHDKAFIAINCGAIPENLLESELFGHVRGAFTGAIANRVGKFEAADGGTIFLDEIGEMPMPLQVKLLRVLQERAIDKVGESHPTPVDIRVISATNKDLELAVRESAFREDLYYRLNEIKLLVPPLRERGEDVILLAKYLLDKYVDRYPQGRARGFTKDSMTALRRYYWPGNVRQMENRIKKAVIMADQPMLTPQDLELLLDTEETRIRPLSEAQADFTLAYIKQVLELNNWNKTKTARDLDVDPRTIFRYLEKIDE